MRRSGKIVLFGFSVAPLFLRMDAEAVFASGDGGRGRRIGFRKDGVEFTAAEQTARRVADFDFACRGVGEFQFGDTAGGGAELLFGDDGSVAEQTGGEGPEFTHRLEAEALFCAVEAGREVPAGEVESAGFRHREPAVALNQRPPRFEQPVVGLQREGAGLEFTVVQMVVGELIDEHPAVAGTAEGPDLAPAHQAVVGVMNDAEVAAVVVDAEEVLVHRLGEDREVLADVPEPAHVDAAVDRIVQPVETRSIHRRVGEQPPGGRRKDELRLLPDRAGRVHPVVEAVRIGGRVAELRLDVDRSDAGMERDRDRPRHPADQFEIADGHRGGTIRMDGGAALYFFQRLRVVAVGEVELHADRGPGAAHREEAGADHRVAVEHLLTVELVECGVEAAAQLRQNRQLEKFVLQSERFKNALLLPELNHFAERVGVDRRPAGGELRQQCRFDIVVAGSVPGEGECRVFDGNRIHFSPRLNRMKSWGGVSRPSYRNGESVKLATTSVPSPKSECATARNPSRTGVRYSWRTISDV